MKVLIADSSPLVAGRLLEVMQEIPNIDVLTPAGDALAALKSVCTNDPEVIVLEARIPGARGTELLEAIRQEKPFTVVIVLSNHVQRQYRRSYQAAGADLFLDKSTEFAQVGEVVRRLVGTAPAKEETELGAEERDAMALVQQTVST